MALETVVCPDCQDNTHQIAVDGEIIDINTIPFGIQPTRNNKQQGNKKCECGEKFYYLYRKN